VRSRTELLERGGHTLTVRGGTVARMGGTRSGQYEIACSCGWTRKLAATKRETMVYAKDHIRALPEPPKDPR
jgi:hypothetical protein